MFLGAEPPVDYVVMAIIIITTTRVNGTRVNGDAKVVCHSFGVTAHRIGGLTNTVRVLK